MLHSVFRSAPREEPDRVSTASGSERGSIRGPTDGATLATARGTDPEARSLPLAVLTRPQAFVYELLDALPFVGLAGIDIALRVHGDAAHAVELARHTPAVAEARDDLERIAPQDEDLFVVAIGDVEKALLW